MSNVITEALREKEATLLGQLAEVRAALKQFIQPAADAPAQTPAKRRTRKKRVAHMSPEARAKMSAMMKARWALKKKAGAERPIQGGKRKGGAGAGKPALANSESAA
jgi:hypothetical protein